MRTTRRFIGWLCLICGSSLATLSLLADQASDGPKEKSAEKSTATADRKVAPKPKEPVPLNPQPICTQIAGNLYNDDIILSVAHKYQSATKWHLDRPKLV